MTYITSRGHVSVPEDLWAELVDATQQFVEMQVCIVELWSNLESPEEQRALSQSHSQWAVVLQRVRELDALHRETQCEAGRSTREQIERGGSTGPYES